MHVVGAIESPCDSSQRSDCSWCKLLKKPNNIFRFQSCFPRRPPISAWATWDRFPSFIEMQKWRPTSAYSLVWLPEQFTWKLQTASAQTSVWQQSDTSSLDEVNILLFLSDNGSNFLVARKQIGRRQLRLDHDYIKDPLLNTVCRMEAQRPFCSSLRWSVGDTCSVCQKSSSVEPRFRKTHPRFLCHNRQWSRLSCQLESTHPRENQPRSRQSTYPKPFLAWKALLQCSWSRFERNSYFKEFDLDTGEAELEEAANRVCSFAEQTTEVDVLWSWNESHGLLPAPKKHSYVMRG